jgi:hypothetical protein
MSEREPLGIGHPWARAISYRPSLCPRASSTYLSCAPVKRDAEIQIKKPPLSQILLEKGTADAHFQSVATPCSQHQATRRKISVSPMKHIITIFVLAVIAVTAAYAEIVFPRIIGKKGSTTGETDNSAVRCILREGTSNQGTVEGQLIVKKSFIGKGVSLAAKDDDGLVCAWGMRGEEKNGEISYGFILRRTLVERAEVTLFTTDDQLYSLPLSTVPVLPKKKS